MILQCSDREQIQAANGAAKLGIPFRFSREVGDQTECHVGTVEWCQEALGIIPVPIYYPEFLLSWRHRNIWYIPTSHRLGLDLFCKPAWAYKSGNPIIVRAGAAIPACHWACEVVKFTDEWRYYVADGEVLGAGWYSGPGDEVPAPQLDIAWPKGFCGAVDFGRLDDGRIALVESHHPYGCGNYLENDECEAWAMWLELGWRSML